MAGQVPRDLIPYPIEDLPSARAATVERARTLVRRSLEASPGAAPPPFDPLLYARLLDIPVSESRELTDWDALLVPLGDTFRIFCNANVRSPSRRRFSIGHEIAHTFFENSAAIHQMRVTKGRKAFYGSDDALALERLCDLAAAELLMPQPWFGAAAARAGLRAPAVPALAAAFAVSLEAAALRLVETSAVPCAVGFFRFAGTSRSGAPESMAYRVRRAFRSEGFPFLLPEGKSVPESSVVYRASLQRDEMQATEELALGDSRIRVCVSAWPLHRNTRVEEPPTVVAVLQPFTAPR